MKIFCPECGTALAPGGAFCDECGTPAPTGGADADTSTRLGGSEAVFGRPADPAAQATGHDDHAEPTMMAPRLSPQEASAPPMGAAGGMGVAGATAYGAPPPVYPAPAYAAPPPRSGGAAKWALMGVAGIALVAAAFFGTRYVMDDEETTAAPAPSPSATATAAPSEPATPAAAAPTASPSGATATAPPTHRVSAPPEEPAAPGLGAGRHYSLHHTDSGYGGAFSKAATLTSSTTRPFMVAVASAYAESGAAGGSVVLEGVYSPVTGKTYRMTCTQQPDTAVICRGGNNAEVLLYN